MAEPIFTREQVAQRFALPDRVLVLYEKRGLIRAVPTERGECYGPEEIRRLWTVLTLHRDLGVNLAGIEAILRLKAHVNALQAEVARLAAELREALEIEGEPDDDAR